MRNCGKWPMKKSNCRRSLFPKRKKKLKFLLVPADPEDGKNAILEIRAGTGGDEASIFAGDLFRMYSKYCEKKGWRMEVTNISEGTSGGYKEMVAKIIGRRGLRYHEIRIGRAPRAACATNRNTGAGAYFGCYGGRFARSRRVRH